MNDNFTSKADFETAAEDSLASNRRQPPSAAGTFVRQAAILAGASLFVRLLGFLYRIPLTNLIGDVGNTYYITAYQIYTSAIIISVALIPAISRLVSERVARGQNRNAHMLFKTAMLFAAIFGGVTALFMFLGAGFLARLFDWPETASAIRALSPAAFFVSILAVFRGYFQGMKTAVPTALSQGVEQIFKVAFSVWLAFLFFNEAYVERAAAGAAAGTAISVLAALGIIAGLYALVAKELRERADADTRHEYYETRRVQMGALFRTALPIILGMAIFSFAYLLDLRMAAFRIPYTGDFSREEVTVLVGQFAGKFVLLTTLPVSLSMALSSAVIPEITSSKVKMDEESVRQKTNMALRLSMAISIPAAMGLSVLADPILALLFPDAPEGGWLLRYGAVSIIFLALVHILTGVLQGVGHVGLPVISAFFGLIVKIPINYFLMAIPQINILGAVISTIVCYMVAGGLSLYFLRYTTGFLPDFASAFGKPIVAAAGMGMVCFVAYHLLLLAVPGAVATLAALALGLMAYLVFMCFIRGFKQKDLEAIPMPGKLRRLLSM